MRRYSVQALARGWSLFRIQEDFEHRFTMAVISSIEGVDTLRRNSHTPSWAAIPNLDKTDPQFRQSACDAAGPPVRKPTVVGLEALSFKLTEGQAGASQAYGPESVYLN